MENELKRILKKRVKNWWVSILIGLLAIGLGIWCIAQPWSTIIALSMVFAIGFLASGIFEIIFAVSNRDSLDGWGWSLASGILDVLFGIIILSLPVELITLILAFFVGLWVMLRSIWAIGAADELRQLKVSGWGWLLALAILGIIVSFIFIISPAFTSLVVVWMVSISFILYGIFRISYAIKLKSLSKKFNDNDD